MLKKIFKEKEVLQIIDNFAKESLYIKKGFYNEKFSLQNNFQPILLKSPKRLLIKIAAIIILIIIAAVFIPISKKLSISYKPNLITNISPYVLKTNSYLKRPSIIKQMNYLLTKSSGINTMVLVGMAGSGKSMLADEYSYNQNALIVWMVNADTIQNIDTSLECLAYAICSTEQEKSNLNKILKIKNDIKRRQILRVFLSQQIRHHPNWILIFDNMKYFDNLQQILPRGVDTWGKGKVIVTTTNSNIINNSYIEASNIVYVPNLTEDEALDMFTNIYPQHDFTQKSLLDFLRNLPPFPLDISQAAYYIKNTGMSGINYLGHLKSNNRNFKIGQKTLLKNIDSNVKTRNKIIKLSIQHIIKTNNEFRDLLLLISLLNSENIPKQLLIAYKGEVITNNFLQEMSKFSLIKKNKNNDLFKEFSLYQAIQNISLEYLIKSSEKISYREYSPIIDYFMNNRLHKGCYTQLRNIRSYIEKLLVNKHLFTRELVLSLTTTLTMYPNKVEDKLTSARAPSC